MSLCEKCKILIRSRTKSALKKKKSEGVKLGRPKELPDTRIKILREMGYTFADIENELGVSKGMVCRVLKELNDKKC